MTDLEKRFRIWSGKKRNRQYLESPDFADRCNELFEPLSDGELFTTVAMAALVKLPIDIFVHSFSGWLAANVMLARELAKITRH